MKRYQCLIFDWDGTLMDSAQKISESLRASAADMCLPVPSDSEARNIIGLGLQESMQALFGDINQTTIDGLVERYRHHFLQANTTAQPLFDGVRDGLTRLKKTGAALCVATGKNRVGLNRVLGVEDLHDMFFYTRTADEARSKPHPQMLLDILDYMGIDAKTALMIGDTSYDMQMAVGANIDAVGVDYGVHSPEMLSSTGAQHVFNSFAELLDWLQPKAEKLFQIGI